LGEGLHVVERVVMIGALDEYPARAGPTVNATADAKAGPMADALRLSLLGGFELRFGEDVVSLSPSGERLVAFLALREKPVRRSYVAGILWVDATEVRAAGSLRSTLWRLAGAAREAVSARGNLLSLADGIDVDVHRTAAAARWLLQHADDPVADGIDMETWASGLASELLPDWYDDWVLVEREHLRQLRLHALEALCRRLTLAGRFGEAVEAGLAAVAAEPLRESAHRTLIAAHLAHGNNGEALRQYNAFCMILSEELHLRPTALMETLVAPLQPSRRW
jgi:DNA-binding SARP family transcriptional activator